MFYLIVSNNTFCSLLVVSEHSKYFLSQYCTKKAYYFVLVC